MSIKKFKDWPSWWDGLRTSMIKAGATSLVTNLTVFTTTNTVNSMGIPGLANSGENWRTLCIGLIAQFGLHTIYAAATYIQANPDAQVVTEVIDTTHIVKNDDGSTLETGASTTTKTTVTPVEPTKI